MKNKCIFFLFFLLLAAPPLTFPVMKNYIDSSNYEKRKFAEMPELSLQNLPTFSAEFDAYFNDHLPYKNQLVMLNNIKNEQMGVGTSLMEYFASAIVIRGKDNWLFYNALTEDDHSFDDYMCNNLYEEEELAEIAEGYTLLKDALADYGIELMVIYAANKEQVYPEFMPEDIVPLGSYSRTDQLVDYIRAHTDVPLLYTKEALQKEKKNHQVFYKYDTHWNNLGGFVGTQLINEYFHGEYVSLDDVRCAVVKEGQSGDLADVLSMRNIYNDDVVYNVEDYKNDVTVTAVREDGKENYFEYTSNAADDRSVLVIMDSFGYAMMGMGKDFGHVTYIRDTSKFKEYCEAENGPDIVVIEIVERQRGFQERWCRGLYELL